VVRYRAPIIPAIGIVAGAAASDLFSRLLPRLRSAAEVAARPVLVALLVGIVLLSGVQAADRLAHWRSLQESTAGMKAYLLADSIAAKRGGRILQLGFENGKDFAKSAVIGDWFGPWRYRQFVACSTRGATVAAPCELTDAARLTQLMVANGASVPVVNLDRFSFDQADYDKEFLNATPANGQAVLVPQRPR
jgi:hypothetical protein